MSEPAVLTDVANGVMTITINRPQAKNAVNKDVAEGIAAALDALDADDSTHVVILTNRLWAQIHVTVLVKVYRGGRWTASASCHREFEGNRAASGEVNRS